MMIVFQPKKKKLFYHQRTKKLCVIEETKTKFFATIVNQYKYQLTVVFIKNKIKYFIKLYLFLKNKK